MQKRKPERAFFFCAGRPWRGNFAKRCDKPSELWYNTSIEQNGRDRYEAVSRAGNRPCAAAGQRGGGGLALPGTGHPGVRCDKGRGRAAGGGADDARRRGGVLGHQPAGAGGTVPRRRNRGPVAADPYSRTDGGTRRGGTDDAAGGQPVRRAEAVRQGHGGGGRGDAGDGGSHPSQEADRRCGDLAAGAGGAGVHLHKGVPVGLYLRRRRSGGGAFEVPHHRPVQQRHREAVQEHL